MVDGLEVPSDWETFDSDQIIKGLEEHARKISLVNRERASAIIRGAELEELLGELLFDFFVDDKASKQLLSDPLASFGSRIHFAFCMGLISKDEFNDLNIVRKIRNHFAHSRECSFQDQKVIDLCTNLRIPKQRPDLFDGFSSFESFEAVVLVLAENISERMSQASKRKCEIPSEVDSTRWEEFWS